jgi:hypothetical protein
MLNHWVNLRIFLINDLNEQLIYLHGLRQKNIVHEIL